MTAKYIVSLALALTVTQANAAVVASLRNQAGGEIILTDTKVELCGDNWVAYTTSPKAPTVYGCWWFDERMVHITYDNYKSVRSYLGDDFTYLGVN